VPNDGGQVEIVSDRCEVLYNSVDDAVAKIKLMLDDRSLQEKIHHELMADIQRFSTNRFRSGIKSIVRDYFADSAVQNKSSCSNGTASFCHNRISMFSIDQR